VRAALTPLVGACDGRPLALRLRLTGASPLHAQLVADRERLTEELQAVTSTLSDQVYVEKLIVDTQAPGIPGTLGLPLADLEEAFATAIARPDFRRDLAEYLALIRAKAPREALALLPESGQDGGEDGGEDADIETILAEARELILSRLACRPAEAER
jgi:hypothetical protein